ncbi:Nucleolar protein 58 [Xanthoria parietina]
MGLFILQETPVGYALLKAKSSKLLKGNHFKPEDDTAENICSLLKLREFHAFDSAATALEQSAAIVEGKVTPTLAGMLDAIKDEKKASLAVADPKLASAINKLPQLSLSLISDASTADLYRSIRNHLSSLIPALVPEKINTMSLGLSHSLSRHKLKFSPDKVDTMIIQAIALLDDLDKELNIYAMRVKEWYGWHFPEMARIVNDNLAYSKIIISMGMRTNAVNADLAEILPEEIETAVKAAAEVSMGTEITPDDLDNIRGLAEQVVSFTDERAQLSSYLAARMQAVAPNLTALVGELVGARLIAHAGSLMNLAKSPASTIQILGAEKALFRALKTKHDTPKYGLIYHASLIGQATGKNKGKIARVLAAKASLGLRVDALADWSAEGEGKGDAVAEEDRNAHGVESRLKIERRLAALEGKPLRSKGVAIAPNGVSMQPGKWEVKEARKYNPDADGLAGDEPAATAPVLKKPKKEKVAGLTQLIQEVDDNGQSEASASSVTEQAKENDVDMDEAASTPEDVSPLPGSKAAKTAETTIMKQTQPSNGGLSDDEDEFISAVSDDTADSPASPTRPEKNEQSSILGTTKDAKKARKKERHERKAAMAEERSQEKEARKDRIARKPDGKERRQKKGEQKERRQERDDDQDKSLAEQAGLSVSRYKRKLERGEIKFDADGKPSAISKKEMKKAKKAAEEAGTKGRSRGSSGKRG